MSKIQYKDNTRNIQFPEIQTEYPIYNKVYPQQNDYDSGVFNRFFVKKINDGSVYEISKENYSEISPRLYIRIVIEWKLVGKRNDIYKNKIKIYQGVFEFNRDQINNYKKIMPGIENILRDPIEYWKPS